MALRCLSVEMRSIRAFRSRSLPLTLRADELLCGRTRDSSFRCPSGSFGVAIERAAGILLAGIVLPELL